MCSQSCKKREMTKFQRFQSHQFLPITALILQNATTLSNLLHYQVWSMITKIVFVLYHLLERSGEDWSQGVCCNSSGEVHHQHAEGEIRGNPSSWQQSLLSKSSFRAKVAFYIFTNGRQTLGLNLTERFSITDNALENMPWPDMDVYDATKMFKSKV